MAVTIKNLFKSYKSNVVLKNINIRVNKPGIYLIAGPNGSGKSTLLEIIVGLRAQTSGEVKIMGASANSIEAKKRIGFMSQQNSLRRNCYVYEEIQMIMKLFGIKNVDMNLYLEKYGLEKYLKYKTKKLSGGTKRRLLVAMTLLASQDIIILDEPVSGLDSFSRNEIWNMITEVSQDRMVIVSDHYLNQAAQYSDYIFLLDNGKLILEGSLKELRSKTNKTHVVKIRRDKHEIVEYELKKRGVEYELKVSGTLYSYYIGMEKKVSHFNFEDEGYRITYLDFEDIYFYHTGRYSHERGEIDAGV
ncbi:ABC transporter ATP-binding protein [Candidatus Enterococcus courvalinii]|uniref:ABC transporter ATP-binding protein n=1 Tax=Candidatus Enterococcus courvalinii TaxID=2815329 RepID=A0ABS3HXS2_9ENTE|nr:ABC transporter ATP-binding protein [Enterococcus sp. MSG2901]MBO0481262.1 ABC transporter ATP-binding protein [Enterococcus sp. MSG2901]